MTIINQNIQHEMFVKTLDLRELQRGLEQRVQHMDTITARLPEQLHASDLLRAAFPGGSITGAPKVRAMEIIDELEPQRRNA